MILTAQRLPQICKAVWGEPWVAVLAKKLRVSKRTVQRWKAGTPMPGDLHATLLHLVETQLAIVNEQRMLLMENWDDSL